MADIILGSNILFTFICRWLHGICVFLRILKCYSYKPRVLLWLRPPPFCYFGLIIHLIQRNLSCTLWVLRRPTTGSNSESGATTVGPDRRRKRTSTTMMPTPTNTIVSELDTYGHVYGSGMKPYPIYSEAVTTL